MRNKINNKKIEKYLFIFSLMITSILGLIVTYNYEFNNNLNLLFDSDTARVIGDASSYFYKHYRSIVHPLYILIIQPLCYILNGITLDRIISLVIISSLATSVTVLYIYKILNTINNNPKQNIIISLIYLFSFGNIIFTAGIEVYNIAVLFIILLWYYYIIKRNKSFDKYSYIILILLGITTAAITITNFLIFFIILFLLYISKKIDIKKAVIISLITGISLLTLNIFQHFVWRSAPTIWQKEIKNETTYMSKDSIGVKNITNVVKNNYYNSLISNNVSLKVTKKYFYKGDNYVLQFSSVNYLSIILVSILYILTIFLLVRNIKLYGNNSTFLYSLHFIYIIILLLGINLSNEKNPKFKKIINIFLIVFLFFQVIINSYYFYIIIKYIKSIIKSNILVEKFGLLKTVGIETILVLLVTLFSIIICTIIKKLKKGKSKEEKIILFISIIGFIIIIEIMFCLVHFYQEKDNYKGESLNIENYLEVDDKTKYLDDDFKKYYKEEFKALESYKKEYIGFINDYNSETNSILGESECYYFGFASRRKLVYKSGILMDLNTKKTIYSFNEKESLIIPNLYTIIIKTNDNKYIKISEDEEGVHYFANNKDTVAKGS